MTLFRAAALALLTIACGGEGSTPDVDAPAGLDATRLDGATTDGGPRLDAAASASATDSLLGSQFLEGEFTMTSGASLTFTIAATHDVEWNVHSHPGSEAIIHTSGTDAAVRMDFTAPTAGSYYLLVKNPPGSDPVEVTASLWFTDGVTFTGWL